MVPENGSGRRVGSRATFPQPCAGNHSEYPGRANVTAGSRCVRGDASDHTTCPREPRRFTMRLT